MPLIAQMTGTKIGRMGRDLGDWGFHPVLADLLHIARRLSYGINDERVRERRALTEHPAVRVRQAGELDPRRALAAAARDAESYRPNVLNEADWSCVRLLLAVPGEVSVGRVLVDPATLDLPERRMRAAEISFHSVATFTKIRPTSAGSGWGPEVAVLSRFKLALDLLEPPPSATAAFSWTPTIDAAAAEVDDMTGTWKGIVRSNFLLRSKRQQPLREQETYLVLEQGVHGLLLWNLVEEAVSHGVVARCVTVGTHRRLFAIYEVAADFATARHVPLHRGALLFEVDEIPAARIAGAYWNDRGTRGQFSFELHSRKVARDYASAVSLFSSS